MVSNWVAPDSGHYSCVVCEWSESHRKNTTFPRGEMYNHFRTVRHLNNWKLWCSYLREQRLSDDYIEDWLQQHHLLSLHRNAVAEAGGPSSGIRRSR